MSWKNSRISSLHSSYIQTVSKPTHTSASLADHKYIKVHFLSKSGATGNIVTLHTFYWS